MILHHSINKACIDRVAGFQEEMAKCPAMKLLDIQEGKGTTEAARPVMRDLLGRFPDVERRVSDQRPQCTRRHLRPGIRR